MKRERQSIIFPFLFICLLINSAIFAQSEQIKVKFMNAAPVIDGFPDPAADSLKEYKFTRMEASSKDTDYPDAGYKIAYTPEYLYLLIRVSGNDIIFRDRAYQNGDGFHMVIASPKENNEDADEFYVLRFSPKSRMNNFPGLKAVWYYNIDLTGRKLDQTRFETGSERGNTYYELLLPWSDIQPYHPFMRNGMGFNLCFVKASGKSDKVYYYTLYDKKIQWEQNKRKYVNLNFEEPAGAGVSAQFFPEKRSVFEGTDLKGELVVYSPKDTLLEFAASVVSPGNYSFCNVSEKIKGVKGYSAHKIIIPSSSMIEGDYSIRWRLAGGVLRYIPVTILPSFDREALYKELGSGSSVSEGAKNTITWRINEISSSLQKLKSYEASAGLRESIIRLDRDVKKISAGEDIYKAKRGIFRRAYLAKLDNTYQPYSIKVPDDFNPSKKYPLLIMLHGSGQDDRGILNGEDFGNGKFILAAPNGRGTSNCYSVSDSQDDIKSCIEDVVANYNIDESKIILAGFSMGGYGVFRTFYETPRRFAGLALFSGHPNLASKWMTGTHPDFTDANTLKIFKDIPMFIYHDKTDLNCPYDIMERTANLLTGQGTNLKFVVSSGKGHNIINETNRDAYYAWLEGVLQK